MFGIKPTQQAIRGMPEEHLRIVHPEGEDPGPVPILSLVGRRGAEIVDDEAAAAQDSVRLGSDVEMIPRVAQVNAKSEGHQVEGAILEREFVRVPTES
jgi:hypothetical protein